MDIWHHADLSRIDPDRLTACLHLVRCPYCDEPLSEIREASEQSVSINYREDFQLEVFGCLICGWWRASARKVIAGMSNPPMEGGDLLYAAIPTLQELNTADISRPMEEIQRHLLKKYDARFQIHPRAFEEVVASVFRGLGYKAVVTAYSGDDGLDIILSKDRHKIGVQVKRYRNSIEVEQIRSLVGALVLKGYTRGIFVTTSTFQRGADRTADLYNRQGYKIELVDAARFLSGLEISQRPFYRSLEEFAAGQRLEKMKLTRCDAFY